MPDFAYIAADAAGERMTGTVSAPTEDAARSLVSAGGWSVVEMTPVVADSPVFPEDDAGSRRLPGPLSLLTNLRALSEDLPSARVRGAVQEMADRIERGETLSVAYDAVHDRLPAGMRTLLALGLARGKLDVLLAVYLDHARRLSDIRTALWLSLAYPLGLLGLVTLMCLFMAVLVIPMFEEIFRDFDIELPGLTLSILQASRVIRDWGWLLLVIAVALWIAVWLLLRLSGGRSLPQAVFRRTPCVGTSFRWCSLASCAETLAMLVELEVPLPEALRTAATTSDDYALADGLLAAASELEQGASDARSLPRSLMEFGGCLRWTGRPAMLVESLRTTGEVFAARSRVDLHLARWLLEPVILMIIAVGVGMALIALFLPLIKLLNDLS